MDRSVLARRQRTSRTSTGRVRQMGPTTRGTGFRVAGSVEGDARVLGIHPFERRGEPVGVALAADLAIRDDVHTRPFHVTDGEHRGVILGLLQQVGRDPPDLWCASPRRQPAAQLLAVDQPVRLGVAADDGCREKAVHRATMLLESLG